MAIFGGKDKKEAKKDEKRVANLEKFRLEVEASAGEYYTRQFSISDLGKKEATAMDRLYKQIVEFSNYYNLDIIKVADLAEDFVTLWGISVIFKKR